MMNLTGSFGGLRVAVGVGALSVALGALLGCDESGPRVYTAQLYEPDLACLDAYAPIGLVEAEDISSLCEPVCLRTADGLHVSTLCAPYPAEATLEGPESTECVAALAAGTCDELETEGEVEGDAGAP